MSVLGERAHERQINVNVWIDEAWENEFTRSVDYLRAGRGGDVAVNTSDGFVFAKNVGNVAFACGNDFAIFDQERHAQ